MKRRLQKAVYLRGKVFFQGALILSAVLSCEMKSDLFTALDPEETGIAFSNTITENDTFNISTVDYLYNGGGVAIADFDRNGLQDIYFTGSVVGNRLYLNKSGFNFEDVTSTAKVAAESVWSTGVNVVDINRDGWPDIYVCASNQVQVSKRTNKLFINRGLNSENIPVFQEMSEAYGVNDTTHTTMSAFFDYDNDGDLDLFLAVNQAHEQSVPNMYRQKVLDGSSPRTDRLYRNEWDEARGHARFRDVSKAAGVTIGGYSLGLNIVDINNDGWKDIFVSNDFVSNDLLYINNGDGTFIDRAADYFKHTSISAMGNDIADLNNDGRPDIFELDMLPEDNYRRKTMVLSNNYNTYINNERLNYYHQYVRNTIQLNLGTMPGMDRPVFSEIGMYAGIEATDWSWAPLLADFDNDGYRDIIVTNGYPRDVTDLDFLEFMERAPARIPMYEKLAKAPSVKIKNYAFKNRGDLTFKKVSEAWGIETTSFSNGAAYADLDNDGDLDYVINNINDMASVYKNNIAEDPERTSNWIRFAFVGPKGNPDGYGAKVTIEYGAGLVQSMEYTPFRGYASTMEPFVHFGLGAFSGIGKVAVDWPCGKKEVLEDVRVNQILTLKYQNAHRPVSGKSDLKETVFKEISSELNLEHIHKELDYLDFNVQPLLLHKLSQYGPGIAVGDINGDRLDDIYLGGSRFYKGSFLMQETNGTFRQDSLTYKDGNYMEEELGVLLFDADGDEDPDLYTVGGGYEFRLGYKGYRDKFFENQGGTFVHHADALPAALFFSGLAVKAADYDRDGDLDLFVGGRVVPFEYPRSAESVLLRNESNAGTFKFVADTEAAGLFQSFGLVSDALWTDFNDDGWVDLVVAGEWMPPVFLKNSRGKLENITEKTGVSMYTGFWNSIGAGDFDNDGDTDYVFGNLGLNTSLRAHKDRPIKVYAGDFDVNGKYDLIPSAYIVDSMGTYREYPVFGLEDMSKQIPSFRSVYPTHAQFALADMNTIMDPPPPEVLKLEVNHTATSYVENVGNERFLLKEMPVEAQFAPIYGMLTVDYNDDGAQDLLMVGNDYGTELLIGRYDAFNGLLLEGDGQGSFRSVPIVESGFYVPGDAKGLTQLIIGHNRPIWIATQNSDSLRVFSGPGSLDADTIIALDFDDSSMVIETIDGKKRKEEFYYGHTFLAQKSRKIIVPGDARYISVKKFNGEERVIDIN
ncbi:MAG: VCBS repeat-containing protein [Cytophagales bacterium]|nr:VCBS repeat-containing protein [Cytophagales bacterium]